MMQLTAQLASYGRHLAADVRRQVGVRHLVVDTTRFVRRLRPSRPVSAPPHPLHLYRTLLERILADPGCVVCALPEHVRGHGRDPQRIGVVLRHDLDAGDPEVAAALCAVERELGLRSSVHVLVDGALYDPARLAPLARALHDEGFDVGLHTQAWMHEDFAAAFRADVRRFEQLFGFAPRTFTQHGAWPRTDDDLRRRRLFTQQTPQLIEGTSILGYNNRFDWVSEDSNIMGRPAPIREQFFRLAEHCYLGGAALVLTHDNHWQPV